MKVFLDTDVWFSAVATPGLCEALVKQVFETNEVVGSELVWMELSALLVQKLRFSDEELAIARAMFEAVSLTADVAEPAGDNDARLVAAALAAGAELFVTGDRRVLAWKASGALRIVTPRQAWIHLFARDLEH
ncbi:MAG: PIN domain-containing protein [Rhodocyclaceae bacterium]|nr:PIN domain-containing protein [Rhodocyclaceae bacterium]MBX3667323.1 PIN domain-containing protein [Rhodocyclaceae bacterium]